MLGIKGAQVSDTCPTADRSSTVHSAPCSEVALSLGSGSAGCSGKCHAFSDGIERDSRDCLFLLSYASYVAAA
jgi:hypothetical protein